MAQISPRLARTYFAEISADSALPLDPDDLVRMVRLRQHGHVVIGDIAIRCYKHKSKWTYDERDIRRAAQAFADLRLDLDDVVEVQLPPYHDRDEENPEEWGRADWRESIASWMFWSARHKHQEQRHYDDWNDSWQRIGAHGLPGDLTWEEFTRTTAGAGRTSPAPGRWS
ncbi:endonuclease VII [Streptomyces lavendofoliae]|uniref:endonuclease VII n=1 Tax=Streptomyces lavendofoliae TaxID=67314 RepID=UPI003D916BDB